MNWRGNKIAGSLITAVLALSPLTASALTFSPIKIMLEASPGASISKEIQVYNEGSGRATVHISATNFLAGESAGTPEFTDEKISTGLAELVALSYSDFVLGPDERRTYSFTIRVPETTPSGSYHGAIHFASTQERALGGIGTVSVTGPLVFLKVGTGTEQLSLEKVELPGRLLLHHPESFRLTLKNQGNVDASPRGLIEVKNIIGTLVASYEINPEGLTLLPGEQRELTASDRRQVKSGEFWQEFSRFGVGPYSVEARLGYGDGNKISKSLGRYVVVPVLMLAMVAIGCVLLAWMLGVLIPNQPEKKKKL